MHTIQVGEGFLDPRSSSGVGIKDGGSDRTIGPHPPATQLKHMDAIIHGFRRCLLSAMFVTIDVTCVAIGDVCDVGNLLDVMASFKSVGV